MQIANICAAGYGSCGGVVQWKWKELFLWMGEVQVADARRGRH